MKGKGLAEDKFGFVIKPQQSICIFIKPEGNLLNLMSRKSSLQINVCSFSRRSNLDLVIALNFCIVVNSFSIRLRKLFQIYSPLKGVFACFNIVG